MNNQNQILNMHANPIVISVNSPFIEETFRNSLSSGYQTAYNKHYKEGGCCCTCGKGIKGAIIFHMVMSLFIFGLSFGAKFTTFSSITAYKELKDLVLNQIEREDQYYELYSQKEYFRFDKFWYKFEDFEEKIILADIVCPIIYIVFLTVEIIIYFSFLNKETKSGMVRGILIFINFLFGICFRILFVLLIYLLVYSAITLLFNPGYFLTNSSIYDSKEDDWSDQWTRAVIHLGIILVLMIFNGIINGSDQVLFFLLEMWNEDEDNEIDNRMDKIKTKSISMADKNINIQINLNKALYLKGVTDKNYEFRQILLENIKKDYLYIDVENESISNMLSISGWKYPNMDPVINYLKPITSLIFYSVFIIYLPTIFHIKDQPAYEAMKELFKIAKPEKVHFIPIFKIIGSLEKPISISRFYIFVIILVVLELFILKRYFYGGVSSYGLLTLFYALSIICFIITIIFLILSICIIVLSFLSLITVVDYRKQDIYDKDIKMLLYIFLVQIALNSSFFGELVKPILSGWMSLYTYFGLCRSEMKKLYDSETQGKTEYEFIGLDNNTHKLTEVNIEKGFPRYLFYSLNNEGINNINQENEKVDNINTNRLVSEESKLKVSVKK